MTENHDVLIVGASISGLYAASRLAEAGWQVLVLDKRKNIGLPVRCGEATGNRAEIERFMPFDESYIAATLTGLSVHVSHDRPFGRDIPDCGVILKRDMFELRIAQRATRAGAVIRLETTVSGLAHSGETITGVVLENGEAVSARWIIGADGSESAIGRRAGMLAALDPADAYSAAQYTVSGYTLPDNHMHFYVGAEFIPRGYIWVFPKGEGKLSIGAGLYGSPKKTELRAIDILHEFLDAEYPGLERSNLISGCAPLAVCPKQLVKNNIILVGDAARQVNPLTAGGIMNALEACELMADSLIAAGKNGEHHKALLRYEKKWGGRPRFEQKMFQMFKDVFVGLSDTELRTTIRMVDELFKADMRRDRPFSLPILKAVRILAMYLPKLGKHWRTILK